ncbi:expansin EXLX1 family cellulose-binding protein [Streptomyces niveiscabiei]|uniref:expansin EXLX1 family cellulose-binding protein n=1 Tax=Streptomyces niveiscabiei TaxID=164115 RepID=UPI0029A8AA50|nr:expansin EXLX1 family cellulose-binding protein [Streptomyces niveiscabiei]MDX3385470.1 expansin EXLX1 family cellulose-binding protein [Streptomyces niveiscabiei]
MTSASHRRGRPRPRLRPGVLIPLIAVAGVALIVSLVVALRPGSESHADDRAARAGAGAVVEERSGGSSPSPSGSPSPSTSVSPTPRTSGSPSPSPSAKTPTPKPTSAPPARSQPQSGSGSGSAGSGDAPLAGRIEPGRTYRGVATSYDVGNGDGACTFGPTGDTMTAAMNTADYETSKACGAYVRVSAGGASITVRITNECPAPCAPGQLDLSQQAFAKLAPLVKGRIPISWSLVSPAVDGNVSVRYKTGSSQYWCGIQVLGHRNPVARLEVRAGGAWTRLPRAEYNYFLSEQGAGCGGSIRITDIYGEQLVVDGLPVRANVVQPTGAQFRQR